MTRLRRLPAAVVTCALLSAAALAGRTAASAQAPAGAAGRVVAVGDVHGSIDGLLSILRTAGLVDRSGHWSGGTTTFVQTGDITDRGDGVRRVFDLLRALKGEAAAAGGQVFQALGNHEVMNLVGELRDVTPAICASFAGANAEATREEAWRTYESLVARRSRNRRGENPQGLVRTRDGFRQAYQPGCVEYRLAIGAQGDYGTWLREQPIAVQVQGSVFMHAGAPPADTVSVAQLNTKARDEVRRFDRFLDRLVRADLAAPWFRLEDVLAVAAAEVRWVNARALAARQRGEAPDLGDADPDLAAEAAAILRLDTWSLLAPEGPLWYRGYATGDERALDAPFTALLAHWRADRLVIGHTPSQPFRIRARLNDRLFLIDTGMLAAVYKGVASALELDRGRITAIYADGTRTVLTSAP